MAATEKLAVLGGKPVRTAPWPKWPLFTEQLRTDKIAFALGWFIQERDGRQQNGQRFFSHRGGGLGYVSEVRLYPESGLGSVLLINMTTPSKKVSPDLLDSEYLRQ